METYLRAVKIYVTVSFEHYFSILKTQFLMLIYLIFVIQYWNYLYFPWTEWIIFLVGRRSCIFDVFWISYAQMTIVWGFWHVIFFEGILLDKMPPPHKLSHWIARLTYHLETISIYLSNGYPWHHIVLIVGWWCYEPGA